MLKIACGAGAVCRFSIRCLSGEQKRPRVLMVIVPRMHAVSESDGNFTGVQDSYVLLMGVRRTLAAVTSTISAWNSWARTMASCSPASSLANPASGGLTIGWTSNCGYAAEQIPPFQRSLGACWCVVFFLCISWLDGEESHAEGQPYPKHP